MSSFGSIFFGSGIGVIKGGSPDFYSRAIEAIKTAKDDKYTKGAWASILKGSATKNELDYLGLTELLVGNESISKQELLNLVKDKDIASFMTVKSIPKDKMNPMWKPYSLGGEHQEHIVFQFKKFKEIENPFLREPEKQKNKIKLVEYGEPEFKSEHFGEEYGTNNFAWARTQVGFDVDSSPKYDDLDSEVSELFDNTLIIDEIQSDWIQKGQDQGFASDWTIIKGSDVTKEFIEENFGNIYELKISKYATVKQTLEKTGLQSNKVLYMKPSAAKSLNPQVVSRIDDDRYYTFDTKNLNSRGFDTEELAKSYVKREAVPDLPLKDSKKYVELVLNEMIRKAVKDGRDSIAITNGQIQYNRYEAMGDEERQGLKKFYDTFVYDQLNKIAKNYGVELERIDIGKEGEKPLSEDPYEMQMKVMHATQNKYILQKVDSELLAELVVMHGIPAHASMYSDDGRGQGADYLHNIILHHGSKSHYVWVKEPLQSIEEATKTVSDENLSAATTQKLKSDVKKISWEMPIVPVEDVEKFMKENPNILEDGGLDVTIAEPDNPTDKSFYAIYLSNWKGKGIDLSYPQDAEQLIKMKLPKKLQKKKLSESQKLTKVEQQTQRMFG